MICLFLTTVSQCIRFLLTECLVVRTKLYIFLVSQIGLVSLVFTTDLHTIPDMLKAFQCLDCNCSVLY